MTNPRETNQGSNEPSDRPGLRYGQRPRKASTAGSRPPDRPAGGGYGRPSPPPAGGDPEHPSPYGDDKPGGAGEPGEPSGYGVERQPPRYGAQGRPPSYGVGRPPRYGGETQPPSYGGETQPPSGGGETQPPSYGGESQPPSYGGEGEPTEGGPEDTGYGPVDTQYGPGGEEPKPPDAGGAESHPCPPSMATCDTGAIDDLQCEAKGVAAEAATLAEVAEKLDTRRKAFDDARKAYGDARAAAADTVKSIRRDLDNLDIDIKCLLTDEELDCLEQAFCQVRDCVEECGTEDGCCVADDCDFESEEWTVERIADLTARVEKIEHCFDDELVKEPEQLKARVDSLKALVEKLKLDAKVDPKDKHRLYARLKEAQLALEMVWGSFGDVNEYQDCLCCGLTCSLRGRQVLAQLAGDKAFQECQEKARKKRCDWLLANIVEETLAVLLMVCPPDGPCHEGEEPTTTTQV